MPYQEPVLSVLKEFRLVDANGEPTMVNLRRPKGKPLGLGPMMDPGAMQRLIDADRTPDKHWLRWIFFQAGGGQRAKEQSEKALDRVKKRFIEERINGFQHPRTKEEFPPVSQEEAERRWEAVKDEFVAVTDCADQDAVEHLSVFGFFRHWPGQGEIYEKTVNTITEFQDIFPKLLKMNSELAMESRPELPTEPDQIPTLEAMQQITAKVDRYFASKKARTDIREDTIYSDDYIVAVAPLTYAAAVKYGHDEWAWANRAKFDEVLSGETSAYNDQWKSNTAHGKIYVYLMFKYPVPAWMSRKGGEFKLRRLTNLAMELSSNDLNLINPDSIVIWDEENRNTMRLADVKEMILNEPDRAPDPEDEGFVITRGANVYKDRQEAETVVWHLEKAVKAVLEWAKTFDPKRIKSDALTLRDQ